MFQTVFIRNWWVKSKNWSQSLPISNQRRRQLFKSRDAGRKRLSISLYIHLPKGKQVTCFLSSSLQIKRSRYLFGFPKNHTYWLIIFFSVLQGMHMGYNDDRRFPDFTFVSGDEPLTDYLDAVIISHFHLDHCGALPFMTEMVGYNGPIYMTGN